MPEQSSQRFSLGRTGIESSVIGLGTYHLREKLGGYAAVECLGRAYEAGITLFDTSDNYGTEDIIGMAVRDGVLPRDKIVVATKTGLATSAQEHLQWQQRGIRVDASPGRITQQIERSLRMLGDDVGSIDVYQLHVHDPNVEAVAQADVMAKLIDNGKIRAYGVSNYSFEALRELLDACEKHGLPKPTTTQPFLNVIEGRSDADELAEGSGMTTFAHSPLLKGLLVDQMVDELREQLASRDAPNLESFKQGIETLTSLQEYTARRGLTLAQFAIGWVVAQPNTIALTAATEAQYVSDAITGARSAIDTADPELIEILSKLDTARFVKESIGVMRGLKIYYH